MGSEQAPTPRLPLRGPGSGAAAVRGGEAAGAAGWGRGMWPCLLGGCQGKAVAVQPSPLPVTPAREAYGPKPGAGSPAVLRLCSRSLPKGDNTSQEGFAPVLPQSLAFQGPEGGSWLSYPCVCPAGLPAGTAMDGDSGEGHSDGRCLGVGPGRWALGFHQRLRPQRVSTEGQYLPGLMAESACVWFLCCEMNGLLC